MESIAKADIFFTVTTIAVVALAICMFAILIYILCIVRDVRKISKKFVEGSNTIANDFAAMHESVKKGLRSLIALFKRPVRKSGRKQKKKDKDGE